MNAKNCWQQFCHIAIIIVSIIIFYSLAIIDGAKSENNDEGYMDVDALVQDAIDWAHNNFMIMRTPQHYDRSDTAEFSPFTLFPSPIPRKFYNQAVAVQEAMSLLYLRISCDFDFLKMAFKDVIESDKSIRIYMELLEEMKKEGIKQPWAVFSGRSDYMVHQSVDMQTNELKYELKQIEMNGASMGTACFSQQTTQLHRRMLQKAGVSDAFIDTVLPANRPSTALNELMYQAWLNYDDPNAIILFIDIKDRSPWHFTKYHDHYELERLSNRKTKIVHLTIGECGAHLKMDDDFTLRLDGRPVAVAYKNIVYIGALPTVKMLNAMRMIERSKAIKFNSLFFELSTSKKVQQLLAQPGMVEQFFQEPSEAHMVAKIRATFANIWGLENDDPQTQAVIADAIAHPERYVLKPNKEGGGKNFWGEEITQKLKTFTKSERAAHILMERLNPVTTKNFLVRPRMDVRLDEVVTEIGIYGFFLGNLVDGTMSNYDEPGNMIRTKLSSSNEGGVSAGNGVFDTPYLYD